jgi:integrase
LRVALSTAMRWNLVARNVATLVDVPRTTKHEIAPFDTDQSRAFLGRARGHRLEALFTVGVALGLRQGEILGLCWEDVNLEDGSLRVRRALQRFGGDAVKRKALLAERKQLREALTTAQTASDTAGVETAKKELVRVRKALALVATSLQFTEPKSERSRRTVSLPGIVAAALRAHRTRQLEERLKVGPAWEEQGLVFATPIGTPLDPRNVHREFRALVKQATLPAIRFHDLRHTAASLLLAQGVAPRTIMETLGHSQISLTMDTYSHLMPALRADAAAKMDEILSAGRKAQ